MKTEAAPMTVRLREKAPTAMVVAFQAGTDDIAERVECRSADEAGRAVANLLLRGFAYCHVDNLSALERYRSDTA